MTPLLVDPSFTDPSLAEPHAGLPPSTDALGGSLWEAVAAIAAAAGQSMAAAWVLWSQRSAIEALLASFNAGLREYRLPQLLDGSVHGTTALCDAAADHPRGTPLPLVGTDTGRGWQLDGHLPWVTNVPNDLFLLAVPASLAGSPDYSVLLLSSEHDGLRRHPLDLPGLHRAHTVSFDLGHVHFREDEMLHTDGPAMMRRLRPALAALQCGVAIGMIDAALACSLGPRRRACDESVHAEAAVIALDAQEGSTALRRMLDGDVSNLRFDSVIAVRRQLFDLAQRAVQLELRCLGSKAYLHSEAPAARRWREAALLPQFESIVR